VKYAIIAGLLGATMLIAADAKLSADQMLARHLASIGPPEARAAVRSRVIQGTVQFTEIISGKLKMQGQALLASTGRKSSVSFVFGQASYPAEKFVFDGQRTQIATINPGSRSNLGTFLDTQTEIINDGLLGGVLFTGWALLDLKDRQAKLKYEGLKKVDNLELHEVTYTPKKHSGAGELVIHLYFDPETFRHVETDYKVTIRQSNNEEDHYQTLQERFDTFHTIDGVTLPQHWQIQFREDPQVHPAEFRWDVMLGGVVHNTIN
jgi:hypothetical protein